MSTINLIRGDSATVRIFINDETGAPLNLSGRIVRMTAKRSFFDPDAQKIFSIDTTDRISVVGVGEAVALINSEDTRNVDSGNYVYDVKVQWTDGGRTRRKTPIIGDFNLLPVVQRGE